MSSSVSEKLKTVEEKIQNALKSKEQEKASAFIGSKAQGVEKMTIRSTEKKLLDSFGVGSVKKLLEKNLAAPEYKHLDSGTKAAALQLKQDVDLARATAQIFYGEPLDKENKDTRVDFLQTKYAKDRDLGARLKAFGSEVAGEGDEWVPTLISQSYLEEFHLEHKVASLFQQVPMGSSPFEVPVQTDSKKAKLVGEGATNASQTFGTDVVTLNAKKASDFYELPEELHEDSAPAILQLARKEVVDSVTRAIESAILNGDTTATHMDNDITAASDFDKAWKGLRKLALESEAASAGSVIDAGGNAVVKADLIAMRAAMGRYGVDPSRLAYIVSPAVYSQLMDLDIVQTLDKFGPNATVLSGSLGAINGISVLVSEHCREDLSASGVNTLAGPNTFSAAHLVNFDRFMMGMRRPIRIRVAQDPRAEFDRYQLVSYTRQSFAGRLQAGLNYASGTASEERSSILLRNIGL
jgi:HK97 family phage major capsid protein